MPAQILDGRKIAARIRAEAKSAIEALGFAPGLGVLLVGDDAASHLYVSLKEKACAEAGIRFEKTLLPASATTDEALAVITAFNDRADIHAILVQLPLPAQIDTDRVIAAMDPKKDVDGFHPENLALLKAGTPRITPGLAGGIMELIRESGEDLEGKFAIVVGNGVSLYESLKTLLSKAGVLSVFCRTDLIDLAARVKKSEIVVVAVGQPGVITGDMISPGTIVVDVGTNRLPDGRTVGDCAPSVADAAGWLSPVPGGVGPVTVAMLIKNTVELAKK